MTQLFWKLIGIDRDREESLIQRLDEKVCEAKQAERSLSLVIEEAKATSKIIAGIKRVAD